jgi:hypothetical protein
MSPGILLPFFEWCEASALGQLVRNSTWLFPVIESVHLLGLSLLGGALLIVDLRLLGAGVRRQPIAELEREARPWLVRSLLVMGATGVPLLLSEAIKCYYNPSFWVKITTLPIAILFTFTVRRRVAAAHGLETSARSLLVGVGSLGLWFTVAAAGRWIGFSS